QRSLHYPPVAAEFLARLDPLASDSAGDPTPPQVCPAAAVSVRLVGVQLGGATLRAASPARPPDRRDGLDQVLEDFAVVDVGRGQPDRQGHAVAVHQQMPLGARLGPIRRIRAHVLAGASPPLAGILAESRLARLQSSLPAASSLSSRILWS